MLIVIPLVADTDGRLREHPIGADRPDRKSNT